MGASAGTNVANVRAPIPAFPRQGKEQEKLQGISVIFKLSSNYRLSNPTHHLAKAAIHIGDLTGHATGQVA